MINTFLIIMCGYPYSGKTTIAKLIEKKLGFTRVTVDEIVKEFGLPMEEKLSEKEWTRVFSEAEKRLVVFLSTGRSVAFDATNGHRDYRDKLRKITKSLTMKNIVVFMDIPLKTIYYRNSHVINRHKATGLEDTIKNFTPPTIEENIVIVKSDWNNDKILNNIKEVL